MSKTIERLVVFDDIVKFTTDSLYSDKHKMSYRSSHTNNDRNDYTLGLTDMLAVMEDMQIIITCSSRSI